MVIRKSRSEIEKMRRAGLIVAETLRDLRKMVEPGMTTRELDAYAEKKIRAAGAYPTFKGYRGYPASICASVNDEVVHGIPSDRKLREGDMIKIDCGATLDGYVGDAAISVGVGEVSPEVEEVDRGDAGVALPGGGEDGCRATGSTTSPTRSRSMSRGGATRWCANSAVTGSVSGCTRTRRCRITGGRAPGRS